MEAPVPPGNAQRNSDGEISALDAFGMSLAKKRREAIDGRQQIGIEDEWLEDEEAYIGVDDANRAEHRSTWRNTKPTTSGSWSTQDSKARRNTKSTALVNITRPYVDAASARVADMLLPNDDRCWGLGPTPIPDLDEMAKSEVMITVMGEAGEELETTEKEFAEEVQRVAKDRAKKAETRIEDWLVESQWTCIARQCIEDAARIGSGVLKGPIPHNKRKTKWAPDASGITVKQVTAEVVPKSTRVDPWNLFPDPACGESIQAGEYLFERDYIAVKRLVALRQEKGYLASQIDSCLQEGPIMPEAMWTPSIEIERANASGAIRPFEIWYYHGVVQVQDLESAGVDVAKYDVDDQGRPVGYVQAIITMVNHRVIHAAISPLDDGTFPYDVMPWQRRPGMPWGMGVGRHIRIPQRILTASVRNLMDNAALSAGPQIVINSESIVPIDGVWELTPRKAWVAKGDADMQDVEKAFRVFHIETRQGELMAIIQFALRMAEESTGLPAILQGQQGGGDAASTLGGLKLLQNNASSVLRRLARVFDESISVPHITRYYAWLMEYGQDESEKGDYCVQARGSSTLVERDLQNQELTLMLQMAGNPIYGLDPKKTAEEYLRSRRFDPKRFEPEEVAPAHGAEGPSAAQAQVDSDERKQQAVFEDKQRDRDARKDEKVLGINAKNAQFNAEAQIKMATGSGI